MKNKIIFFIFFLFIFSIILISQEKIQINIGTGSTSGTYYPLGVAISEIINSKISNVNATAVSTGGSIANVNMLKENSIQMAFVQNDIAYYAYNGIEIFQDKKFTGFRALCTLYPETVQIITLANKGIKSISDLRGKKVAVGATGSGTELNARQILLSAGLTYKDINPQYLAFGDAANSLRDGTIDAAFVTAGFPTAAVRDLASQRDIFIIPIPDNIIKDLTSKYPFYIRAVIPKDTYQKITTDTQTLAVLAMLVVKEDMKEDLVLSILKAIYENLSKLESAHSMGRFIKKENALFGISIPLHPAAEKYFKGK